MATKLPPSGVRHMAFLLHFVYSIIYVVITIYHSQIKKLPGIATVKAFSNVFTATPRIHTIPTDINWQTTTLRLPSYTPFTCQYLAATTSYP